jgi:hypothetical protein
MHGNMNLLFRSWVCNGFGATFAWLKLKQTLLVIYVFLIIHGIMASPRELAIYVWSN